VASEAAFRLGSEAPVRSLTMVENPLPGPDALSHAGGAGGRGGASMAMGGLAASMFDGATTAATANGGRGEAPALSPFYQLHKASSYRSSANLSRIMLDLETGFANNGVQWRLAGPARYACDTFAHGAKLEFSVACFCAAGAGNGNGSPQEIVVDVAPLCGCRAAFASFYATFAADLAYAERRPGQKRRFAPPPLDAEVDVHVPAKARNAEATRLCDMYRSKFSEQGGDAARAVAAMASAPESAELFFSDNEPTLLSDAVAHAAACDDACALVACATIANLAVACAGTDAASGWLKQQLPTLKEQLEDSECAHVRRECLRAVSAMATMATSAENANANANALRASIVRAGMVDLLELEALAGAEEGRACEDHVARSFANSALVAVRA